MPNARSRVPRRGTHDLPRRTALRAERIAASLGAHRSVSDYVLALTWRTGHYALLSTSGLVRSWAALAALMLVSCSSDCRSGSCYPLGTYVDPNDAVGATSAEICFDTDCQTVPAIAGGDDVFNGFNSNYWKDGRKLKLKITVFGPSSEVIDSLTESRMMNSSGFACGVLYYGWKNGHLYRIN